MTEAEWLGSNDPQRLLQYLQAMRSAAGVGESPYPVPRVSDRKLRLFACACARQVWHLLTDPRSRQAVEVAERFADGQATEKELDEARRVAYASYVAANAAANDAASAAYATSYYAARTAASDAASSAQADLLRDIVGNQKRPPVATARPICPECLGSGELATSHRFTCYACDGEGTVGPVNPWLTPDVRSLAQAAYEERDPTSWRLDPVRLAILADALEEAGCPVEESCPKCNGSRYLPDAEKIIDRFRQPLSQASAEVYLDAVRIGIVDQKPCACGVGCVPHPLLSHLRSPGPHVRGCWAVDLILGKE